MKASDLKSGATVNNTADEHIRINAQTGKFASRA
jgi:hypothetical protein